MRIKLPSLGGGARSGARGALFSFRRTSVDGEQSSPDGTPGSGAFAGGGGAFGATSGGASAASGTPQAVEPVSLPEGAFLLSQMAHL